MMKSVTLLFLSIILCLSTKHAEAQTRLRPLKSFENDTLAYLKANYEMNQLYESNHSTIGDILRDAEVPFKSYVVAEVRGKYPMIGFILLFTHSADEVRALYRSGKPVYGVFCDVAENDIRPSVHANDESRTLYKMLSDLGTNRFHNLDRSSLDKLKKIEIGWTRSYDMAGWFPMYKME